MKMDINCVKLLLTFGAILTAIGEVVTDGNAENNSNGRTSIIDNENVLIDLRIKREILSKNQTEDGFDTQTDSSGELPVLTTIPDVYLTSTFQASETSINVTTPVFTRWWDKVDIETTPCNTDTNEGCDISQYRRCSKQGICECLNGYALDRDYSRCIAARYFRGEVRLFIDLTRWLNGSQTEEGLTALKAEFRNAVLAVLSADNVNSVLDVKVVEVEERSGLIVRFEIVSDKTNSPRQELLQEAYRYSILRNLEPNSAGSYVIRGTSLVFAPVRADLNQTINSLLLSDYNHCLDSQHNYCDHNAVCTNRMGSFVCRCRVGYTDVSPNIVTSPGEKCAPTCGCENNGTCLVTEESVSCRCPQWFLGEKCEIDGKMLLIVLCSVLGGLLLITMVFCLICVCAFKKKARRAKRSTAATISSIDSTLIKLPRPWMDTSRSYEAPPRDLRRWSYVSEPIRYADELMMEDHYHSETLPLPQSYDQTRRQMAAYQVCYQNPEPSIPQRNSAGQAFLSYGQIPHVGSPYYT